MPMIIEQNEPALEPIAIVGMGKSQKPLVPLASQASLPPSEIFLVTTSRRLTQPRQPATSPGR